MIKGLIALVFSFAGAYIMVLARVLFAYLVSPMAALAWNTGVGPALGMTCITGAEAFCFLTLFSLLFMYRRL